MPMKFTKLTRTMMRKLQPGEKVSEHGIIFERLKNGDGRFSVNIMVDGQRIHRAFGKDSDGVTRLQVEDYIEKAKTEARVGRLQLPKGRKVVLGFEKAAKDYLAKLMVTGGKDINAKTWRLRDHLIPYFKNKPLGALTTFEIDKYKKKRLEEDKAASGTVNRELAVLSHLFNQAVEWKWLTYKPCRIKKLAEGSGRIVYLNHRQIEALLDAAKRDQNPHIYGFIMVGLETSMRRSEILSIRLEYIDLDRQVIYIPHAKAGAREQPMTPHLRDYLKNKISTMAPEEVWLFPSKASRTGYANNIDKAFRRVVADAGLDPKEVVRHTLRHTAITHLVQAGVDLPTVQRISGHKTLSMVVRYSHQNGSHIQAAMSKLDQRYRETQSAL